MHEIFEKIKERLQEYIEEYSDLDENGLHSERWCAMQEALASVNQVAEEYNQSLANNNQSLTNSGWIPCSERLPEDNEIHECTVQFNTGMRYIEYAYYDMAREEWWTHDDTGLVNVIAWKPSPQPYRGE